MEDVNCFKSEIKKYEKIQVKYNFLTKINFLFKKENENLETKQSISWSNIDSSIIINENKSIFYFLKRNKQKI